jgi:hypothetical protein
MLCGFSFYVESICKQKSGYLVKQHGCCEYGIFVFSNMHPFFSWFDSHQNEKKMKKRIVQEYHLKHK